MSCSLLVLHPLSFLSASITCSEVKLNTTAGSQLSLGDSVLSLGGSKGSSSVEKPEDTEKELELPWREPADDWLKGFTKWDQIGRTDKHPLNQKNTRLWNIKWDTSFSYSFLKFFHWSIELMCNIICYRHTI